MKIVLLFDRLEDKVSDPIRFLTLAIDLVDESHRASVFREVTRTRVMVQSVSCERMHHRHITVKFGKVGFEFLVHLRARVATSKHEHGEDGDCEDDEFFHFVISFSLCL